MVTTLETPSAPPLLPGPPAGRLEAVRRLVAGTWTGRAILAGVVLKSFAALFRWLAGREPVLVAALDVLGSIALIAAAGYLLHGLVLRARRRLLWRVRRKLILSYIFIGVVPALLIVAFFIVAGLILFLNVASYLVRNGLTNVTDDAVYVARMTALEVQRSRGPEAAEAILEQRARGLSARYPGASIALVRAGLRACPTDGSAAGILAPTGPAVPAPAKPQAPGAKPETPAQRPGSRQLQPMRAGSWEHTDPPTELPDWVSCSGFGGLVILPPRKSEARVTCVLRGVGLPEAPQPLYAVVVDIPKNDALAARLREETSIKVGDLSPVSDSAVTGSTAAATPAGQGEGDAGTGKRRILWVAWLEYADWASGRTDTAAMNIEVNIADIYDRLSAAQARIQTINLGSLLLVALLVVALLFLLIEAGALVMGLALARSITGSVHELFAGTERVRQGDFSHRIEVHARDQLGELADSFNQMTASIEDLLRQAEEKKRLEEELRIAREIQMSLLPRGKVAIPGLEINTLCVPAREVGGDYYDLLPIDDNRLAVLIADVAGKGTSAALYMAELKGLVLSLIRTTPSPRQLMLSANRIISENLDSRAFITMTYAVIDLQARQMTYARAGHTPLIYRPAATAGHPDGVQILAPDGLVLGLRLDGGELFERLLEEVTLPLSPGDLFLFFTDGISEAMNADSDMFGEKRLADLVSEHGDLPVVELRERLLREIDAFVAGAPQHDDMTMILLKVEGFQPGTVRRGFQHAP